MKPSLFEGLQTPMDKMLTHRNDYTSEIFNRLVRAQRLSDESPIHHPPGLKEFDQYLSVNDPPASTYDLAVESMKVSTRQYAKRQVTWIRNKLIPAIYAARRAANQGPDMYALDATGT